MEFSLTLTGLLGMIIALVLQAVGVEITSPEVMAFLLTAGKIISGFIIYIGRVRQGDVNWFGKKD